MEKLAPIIAVVGSDGSGKSTLAADLLAHVQAQRPAESVYLGLRSGALGNRIKQWPLVGPTIERFFARRAARARDPNDHIPGLGTALVLYWYSLRRKKRFERLLSIRRSGIAVVTDRYPQVEVAGYYDGPGLSAARAPGKLINSLVAKERAIYEWMASYVPTLVIRLNVDVKTALARKPDHDPDLIARKVGATPQLTFNNAPVIDLDSTMAYAEELRQAKEAVDRALKG